MDVLDWPALARGALWVFGLAVALTALSHLRWAAQREGVPLRKALSWDSFLAPFSAGLALVAAGLGWGASRLWETVAWLVLAVLFGVQAGLALRGIRSGGAHDGDRKTGISRTAPR